jgi:hypothetical protein
VDHPETTRPIDLETAGSRIDPVHDGPLVERPAEAWARDSEVPQPCNPHDTRSDPTRVLTSACNSIAPRCTQLWSRWSTVVTVDLDYVGEIS